MSADRFLEGRHAVVTGASRGIGLAIARALSEAGAKLSLLARQSDALRSAQAGIKESQAIACDLRDSAQTDAALAGARQRFGPVSILVNNAGAASSARFAKSDDALWEQLLNINLLQAVRITRTLSADLLSSPGARVIQIASTAGLTGYPYVSAYCASKHALIGMTRALAREWAASDVTVNALCPGYTETDLAAAAIANIVEKTQRTPDEARQSLSANNPQARLIQPDEVAATTLWLCRPQARSITGQAISISGGEVMLG